MTVLFLHIISVSVKLLVQLVSYFENWYIKIIHTMKIYKNVFEKVISLENLFAAWDKFRSDKKKKRDVCEFEWELEKNIFQLHRDLKSKLPRPYGRGIL